MSIWIMNFLQRNANELSSTFLNPKVGAKSSKLLSLSNSGFNYAMADQRSGGVP